MHNNCPFCTINNSKEIFSYELNGNFNPSVLHGALRIHDLMSGNKEFNISREAVKSDNLNYYFNKKELTKDKVNPPK